MLSLKGRIGFADAALRVAGLHAGAIMMDRFRSRGQVTGFIGGNMAKGKRRACHATKGTVWEGQYKGHHVVCNTKRQKGRGVHVSCCAQTQRETGSNWARNINRGRRGVRSANAPANSAAAMWQPKPWTNFSKSGANRPSWAGGSQGGNYKYRRSGD